MCDPTFLRVLQWFAIAVAGVIPIAIAFNVSRRAKGTTAAVAAVLAGGIIFAAPLASMMALVNQCADEAVSAYDKNGDGVVSPTEMQEGFYEAKAVASANKGREILIAMTPPFGLLYSLLFWFGARATKTLSSPARSTAGKK